MVGRVVGGGRGRGKKGGKAAIGGVGGVGPQCLLGWVIYMKMIYIYSGVSVRREGGKSR